MDIHRSIIEFPRVRLFDLPQEIDEHAELLTDLTGDHVKGFNVPEMWFTEEFYDAREIDNYIGLYYVGKKPNKAEIIAIVEYEL